jgi:hypothetical protein
MNLAHYQVFLFADLWVTTLPQSGMGPFSGGRGSILLGNEIAEKVGTG